MPRHGQPYVDPTGIPFCEGSTSREIFAALLRSAAKVIEDGWAIGSLAHWHKVALLPSVRCELLKVNNIRPLVDRIIFDRIRLGPCDGLLLEMAKVLLVVDFSQGPKYLGKGPVEVFVQTVLDGARAKEGTSEGEETISEDAYKLVGELQRQIVHHLMLHGLSKPELRLHVVQNCCAMLLQVWRSLHTDYMTKSDVNGMYRGMYELVARWLEAKIKAKTGDVMLPRILSLLSLFVRKGVEMYPEVGVTPLYEKTTMIVLRLQKQLLLGAGQYAQLRSVLDQGNGTKSQGPTPRPPSSQGPSSRLHSSRSMAQSPDSGRMKGAGGALSQSARHQSPARSDKHPEQRLGARAIHSARPSSSPAQQYPEDCQSSPSRELEEHCGAAVERVYGVESVPDLSVVQRVLDTLYEQKDPWPTPQTPILQGLAREARGEVGTTSEKPHSAWGGEHSAGGTPQKGVVTRSSSTGKEQPKTARKPAGSRSTSSKEPQASASSSTPQQLSARAGIAATAAEDPGVAGANRSPCADAMRGQLPFSEDPGTPPSSPSDAQPAGAKANTLKKHPTNDTWMLHHRPDSAPVENSCNMASPIYMHGSACEAHASRPASSKAKLSQACPEAIEIPNSATPRTRAALSEERPSPGWTPLSPSTPGGAIYALPTPGYHSTSKSKSARRAGPTSQSAPASVLRSSPGNLSEEPSRRCQTARRGSTRHKYIVPPPSTERIVRTCRTSLIPFLRPEDPPMFRVMPKKAPKKAISPSQIRPPPTTTCMYNPLSQDWMEPKKGGITANWHSNKEIEQTGISRLIQGIQEMRARGVLDESASEALSHTTITDSTNELCNDPNSPKNMKRRKKEQQKFLKESLASLRYMQGVVNKM
ncbi:hypothetical protein CYMTET_50474 [Cymbomonas tetramitiformis]|uniref:Uncharacterized protein n=1 Tax=Cymbomonas tetramitiformis TaxID=36881 RepID=A0AAE0BPC1_9CHLO|nr:hypothetical protein CYMTET_50474 [Cymbomonas tetramitiformis]